MKLLVPNWYEQHILRRPEAEWPAPVAVSFANMNRNFYVTMQGPSEMGASGRLVNWDRFNDLKRIQIPTLVISGANDTMDPAYMARMAKQLPHGELAATNGGHMAMYDDQPTYFAGLTAFLRKLKYGYSAALRVMRSRKRLAQPAMPRLLVPLQRQAIRLDVAGDHRTRADDRAVADRDRRHQSGVRTDEGARADDRAILPEPVVIAGDGAGADVGLRPDRGVADVGQMIDLRPIADLGFLELDEIADLALLAERSCRGGSARTGRCSPWRRWSRPRYG